MPPHYHDTINLANPTHRPRLEEEQRAALYLQPRTCYRFSEDPVTEEQLREIHQLTVMGPTAYNNQPLRITWVRSPHAKERLLTPGPGECDSCV